MSPVVNPIAVKYIIYHIYHVEDGIRMMLRKKMALNELSFHFVGYGITQHTKNLWMNPISCVMVVRIPTTVNNHTIRTFKRTILVTCAFK